MTTSPPVALVTGADTPLQVYAHRRRVFQDDGGLT